MRADRPTETTILVVEDDLAIADALTDLLRDAGYAVVHEAAGRPALARLLQRPPDLLLLDLVLPDMDGIEICRQARAELPDLPIIMLTARGENRDQVAGLTAGADDYVPKPVDRAELLARIAAVLRGRAVGRGERERRG